MSSSAKRTIEEHEAARQASGLVPRTIWVPDVSAPGFAEHYRTEMRRLAEADAKDPTIDSFLEAAWSETNASDE